MAYRCFVALISAFEGFKNIERVLTRRIDKRGFVGVAVHDNRHTCVDKRFEITFGGENAVVGDFRFGVDFDYDFFVANQADELADKVLIPLLL